MLVYSTGPEGVHDPEGYAVPPAWEEDYDPHSGCVHSIGYCADWQ